MVYGTRFLGQTDGVKVACKAFFVLLVDESLVIGHVSSCYMARISDDREAGFRKQLLVEIRHRFGTPWSCFSVAHSLAQLQLNLVCIQIDPWCSFARPCAATGCCYVDAAAKFKSSKNCFDGCLVQPETL